MFRLASLLYSLISTALAGTGVIVALVAGYVSLAAILAGAAVGAAVAAPAAWLLARRLYGSPVSR